MKDIINSLDSKDTSTLAAGLQALIAQTYLIEDEYKALKRSYDELMRVMEGVIDRLPSAVWVRQNGLVMAQNSAASALNLDDLLASARESDDHFEALSGAENYSIRREKFAENELIVATNITKEKRAERLQAMGQIATQLAHEIRNPLGGVMLMASALSRKASAREQGIIDQICEGIRRVEQIVANTLQFARGVKAKSESFCAAELAAECEALRASAQNLRYEICLAPAQLLADKALIAQALGNLIYNAFEAASERVCVSGRLLSGGAAEGAAEGAGGAAEGVAGGEMYEICVHDDGELVEDESKLFEAFYTTKLRGNGLGLAIASQIASACGGCLGYRATPQKAFYLRLATASAH